MARIKTKRRVRALVFYLCVAVVVMVLFMYRNAIWVGAVALLNSLAKTYDSLVGR